MLDLRKPAGYFFGVLGIILILTALAGPQNTAPLLDMNLNLYFGIFSVAFGLVFLFSRFSPDVQRPGKNSATILLIAMLVAEECL